MKLNKILCTILIIVASFTYAESSKDMCDGHNGGCLLDVKITGDTNPHSFYIRQTCGQGQHDIADGTSGGYDYYTHNNSGIFNLNYSQPAQAAMDRCKKDPLAPYGRGVLYAYEVIDVTNNSNVSYGRQGQVETENDTTYYNHCKEIYINTQQKSWVCIQH